MKKKDKQSFLRRVIDWVDNYTRIELSKICKPKQDKIYIDLNLLIRNYIKNNNIGYLELADKIGINRETLRTFMKESRTPNPKTLFKIQQFFKDKR